MNQEIFKGKSIVLAVPDHFGLPQRFKENLEKLGFEVVLIPDNIKGKISLKDKLIHGYYKLVKGIKTYKKEKIAEGKLAKQKAVLNSAVKNFDYALFIRPDIFSADLIAEVKKRTGILAAYQWDGLERYPAVYSRIELFDRFFVFDAHDLDKNKKLLPLTNFYFDDIPRSTKNKFDVYFVGTYMKNRIDILLKLSRKIKSLGLTANINLHVGSSEKAKKFENEPVTVISKPLSFTENIINVSQAAIIFDFANDIHFGISMRTFETVGYRKKLITNNSLVKKYDFYNPDNIFVIEDNNLEGLEEFLSKPYTDISEEIVEKYSFTNWIKYVLNIKHHTAINLHK